MLSRPHNGCKALHKHPTGPESEEGYIDTDMPKFRSKTGQSETCVRYSKSAVRFENDEVVLQSYCEAEAAIVGAPTTKHQLHKLIEAVIYRNDRILDP